MSVKREVLGVSMQITSLYIENFGVLHEYRLEPHAGLFVICENNGFGKTTLAAFIKAMLYGLPNTRKSDLDENERKKYQPWQGGAFGGTMTFRAGGKEYRAERFFAVSGSRTKNDTFVLYDLSDNRVTDDYSENLGLELFGIDADGFARSAFLSQRVMEGGVDNATITAKLNNIPVRLLSTLEPTAKGTLIGNITVNTPIKAVAAKDNITAIKIKSGRMLLAYGFLRKVFEIFESHKTPIDMVVTSEVGVSVTIDNEKNLDGILDDLRKFGTVTIDRDMVIICVVGDLEWQNRGYESKVMTALKDIPVRMISFGGSNYNISFLVRKEDKVAALKSLSKELF